MSEQSEQSEQSEMHRDPLTDQELATLPPDVQPLIGWLTADGATWRASLPSTTGLDATVYALTLGASEAPANGRAKATALDDVPTMPLMPPPGGASHAPRRGGSGRMAIRLGGLVGVATMVAVVALLVGVFTLHVPSTHRGRHPAGPTATPTLAPDVAWVDQSRLNVVSVGPVGEDPVVAPSDPRVVYEAHTQYTDPAGRNSQLVLQRTDDAGATWHTLPIPGMRDGSQAIIFVRDVYFLISPLDPHTVILKMYEERHSSCPAIFTQRAGDLTVCMPQYRSTDGGLTWIPLVTPDYRVPHTEFVGLTTPWTGLSNGTANMLRAQGTRLYGAINCPNDTCIRIVASDDNGATWRTVDNSLAARAGVEVQDYAATPTGTTLFAVTSAGSWAWLAPTPLTLWRSDDAGSTWHRIGQLPAPYDTGLMTVPTANPAQPLLYLDAPHITGYATNKMGERDPIRSYTADDLKVSTDGGHTWQSAPASQTPRLRTYPGLLGTLADGSVIVGCVPDGGTDPYAPAGQDEGGHVTLYAWKLGDTSWRQITPRLDPGVDTLAITTTGGKQTLWVTNRTLTPLPLPTVVISLPGRTISYAPQGDLYHVLRFRLP